MKLGHLPLAVAVVALGAGAGQAGPPERTTSRFRGLEGYATYSFFEGCTSGYLDVYAIEELIQDGPGRPAPTAYTAAFFGSYDWCTGQYTNGWGWDTGSAIRGSAVRSLTAQATVPLTVCSYGPPDWQSTCTSQTLLVDVAWEANGESASSGQSTRHTSSPFMTVFSRSVGSTATADVTGTLLLDGTDLLSAVAWGAGGLSRTREGEMTFIRY